MEFAIAVESNRRPFEEALVKEFTTVFETQLKENADKDNLV